MQITEEYAAKLSEYFKPEKPLTSEQYAAIIEPFTEFYRTVLLLHICEGKSLTEISAIRDSNVMRIQQIFSKAERMMKHRIQNVGKKYRLKDFLDKEDEI